MAEFEIHRCLGRGGFGEVYRGVMSRGGGIAMDVAIKVLRPDLDPSSQGVQRLRDEGRLLGRLTHPTILRVYDLVIIEGRAALISEYVDGDDLAHVIRTDARPPPRATYEIVAQVAAALDAAWSWPSVMDGQPLHLVHRDIKPDNIRLDPHGVVKLLDFGIAQASAVEREAETSVNIIMGSAQYLAPERMVQQEVGPESDVFALGCTLYEALTGEALFFRKSMRQMYLLMIEEPRYWPFIDERLAKLDGILDHERARSLLRAMIAYKKQERPTAGDVAARCDTISESLAGPTLRRWARQHPWPKGSVEENGPLEGRTFTSVLSLPAPEARTLALRTEDEWELPDPADALTDPGNRKPALGELSAEATSAEPEYPAPWSGAELVALDRKEAPKPVDVALDDDDSPTVQVRLPEPSEADVTQRSVKPPPSLSDEELVAPATTPPPDHRVAAPPAVGVDEPTVEGITGPDPLEDTEEPEEEENSTGPTDPEGKKADPSTAPTAAVDRAAVDALRAQEKGGLDPATVATDAVDRAAVDALRAREQAGADDEDDDYEPQPGDIDLSSVVGGKGSGDIKLRVAPMGKPAPVPTHPSAPSRSRAPDTRNRVPVMLFSGLMGVLVGAAVISGIAFLVWLVVG